MPRKKGTFIVMDEAEKEVEETGLEEEISEEVEPVEVEPVSTGSVPKRHIANLYQEREPIAKDIMLVRMFIGRVHRLSLGTL